MSFTFDRPLGAAADVVELDYVSALHQTDVVNGVRKDMSIQDVDISLFLTSRYGVQQTPEEVRERILSGVGSKDDYMDMMQLVSLLMIPKLREEQEHRKGGAGTDDLLGYTLEMMLHDVTGSREPKPLTRTLLKQIFQAYGETQLAEDDELVEDMIQQACAGERGSRVMLDPDTFCRALTNDVRDYRVENKDKLSTYYQDAFMSDESGSPNPALDEEAAQSYKTKGDVPTVYTAPSLDNAADTFRSRPLVIFQWIFFVLSYQTYLNRYLRSFLGHKYEEACGNFDYWSSWGENPGVFACTFGLSVANWLFILVVMSIAGLICIGSTGVGNFIECTNPLYPLVATLASFLFIFLPPWFWGFLQSDYDPQTDIPQYFLEIITFALGLCVVLLNCWHFISLSIPKACRLWSWLQNALVPEAIRSEQRNKQAAAHKLDTMIKNALFIHSEKKQETVVASHFGQGLWNFAEKPPKYADTGGFFWTWRMIFSRDLFRREGISFSGRLLSINFTQFVSTAFVLIGGIVITWVAADEYEQEVARVQDFLDDYTEHFNVTDIKVEPWFPLQTYMIIAPLSIGTAVAFVTAMIISFTVLPSATTITIKFRTGLIPFADYAKVRMLRSAPDEIAYLRGIMFWGVIFASLMMGVMIALVFFLLLWQLTAFLAQQITAWLLGAILVLIVHSMFVWYCRSQTSIAYYRHRPAASNVAILSRECGLVALMIGSAVIRVFRLVLTTFLYIGRVDTPFLHEGVLELERFHYRMDNDPYYFRMDILQHEAHRHPYIETLGLMYLLKLRHGDDFCTTAGSSWRLIFVYVLMPWLSRYRAMRRAVLGAEDDSASIMPSPLRAVSLVDARAYALRAVSLIPVASGFIGGSSRGFVGPAKEDELHALQAENFSLQAENRSLQAENRRLKMQLRLMEREALKSDDDEEEERSYVPPPPIPLPPMTRGSIRLELPDEERSPCPPPPKLKRDYSPGLTELQRGQRMPLPPAWKRDQSTESSNLRPPASNSHHVSWKDDT